MSRSSRPRSRCTDASTTRLRARVISSKESGSTATRRSRQSRRRRRALCGFETRRHVYICKDSRLRTYDIGRKRLSIGAWSSATRLRESPGIGMYQFRQYPSCVIFVLLPVLAAGLLLPARRPLCLLALPLFIAMPACLRPAFPNHKALKSPPSFKCSIHTPQKIIYQRDGTRINCVCPGMSKESLPPSISPRPLDLPSQ